MPTLSCRALMVLLAVALPAQAQTLLPADRPVEQVVDHYIDAKIKEAKIVPAGQCEDANLIRRLTLDLNGRIPTLSEVQNYVQDRDPKKREKLVDRLLNSPAFIRHLATELDTLMMGGLRSSIRDYLIRSLEQKVTWDRIFREVMLPDESDPRQKGVSNFLLQRVADPDRLTSEVSIIFFGVNVSCAQCHDHPKVDDWKQDHFYGMKAFLARTFNNGGFLAEREYAEVKFRTTRGENKTARLMFLTGKAIDGADKAMTAEQIKKERDLLEEYKRKKQAPPLPRFSARKALVELALQPGERDFFAKNLANRLWHLMFGRGLVTPLDQIHSANPPSHPELLDWLARDVIEQGYDFRRTLRGLALSKAYSRSSEVDRNQPVRPQFFAVAQVRALTPMQLAASLRIATTDPAQFSAGKAEDFEKKIEAAETAARGFAREIEQPGDDFQIGVGEALLFSNSDRIEREFLSDSSDRLLGRLKTLKTDAERIDLAVWTVLSRAPSAEERRLLGAFLQKRANRPVEAQRQMIWALLTGAEFRFNY